MQRLFTTKITFGTDGQMHGWDEVKHAYITHAFISKTERLFVFDFMFSFYLATFCCRALSD